MDLGLNLGLSGIINICPNRSSEVPAPPDGHALLTFPDDSYVTTPESDFFTAPI